MDGASFLRDLCSYLPLLCKVRSRSMLRGLRFDGYPVAQVASHDAIVSTDIWRVYIANVW
jgi:hypothetical protein